MNNQFYDAFGKSVPQNRVEKALNFLNTVLVGSSNMEIDFVLSCGIRAIEKDRVNYLYDDIKRYLDVTGYYRLIAELTCD